MGEDRFFDLHHREFVADVFGSLERIYRAAQHDLLAIADLWDPNPYSPIHDQDIFEQTEALLDAAAVPCPIVNWGGDEPVAAQEWCKYFGDLLGMTPDIAVREILGTQRGVVLDNTKRMAITGPCRVKWRDGMKELAEAHMNPKGAA